MLYPPKLLIGNTYWLLTNTRTAELNIFYAHILLVNGLFYMLHHEVCLLMASLCKNQQCTVIAVSNLDELFKDACVVV